MCNDSRCHRRETQGQQGRSKSPVEVELHAAGQIPNKMFSLFALLHSAKICFVLLCFLFCRSLNPSVKSNKSNQQNTMQENKKSRAVFKGRQSINAPPPVDVIIDTDLDVPLFMCVCARVFGLAVCRERAPRLLRPLRRAGRAEETQLQVGFTFSCFEISLRRLCVV